MVVQPNSGIYSFSPPILCKLYIALYKLNSYILNSKYRLYKVHSINRTRSNKKATNCLLSCWCLFFARVEKMNLSPKNSLRSFSKHKVKQLLMHRELVIVSDFLNFRGKKSFSVKKKVLRKSKFRHAQGRCVIDRNKNAAR